MQRGRDRVRSEKDLQSDLNGRSFQRRRFHVRWPIALLGSVFACGLLWMKRADVAYLLSPRQPIPIGSEEGGYHFDRLVSNRYAEVHGIPSANAAYSRDGGTVYVVVGLQNTPILVRREALPTEDWVPHRPPPRPDPRPFGVRGRLLSREDAPKYEAGFQMLALDVAPREGRLWILLDEERPGEDVGSLAVSALLGVFAVLDVWFFLRAARRPARTSR